MHIRQCVEAGALNKVSVFPNFDPVDLNEIAQGKPIRLSLHLNLVEGKCLADPKQIGLLADDRGILKHTFCGLLLLNLFQRKAFESQVCKEVKAQVRYWKSILPQGIAFCMDTHQHASMIPGVFRAMLKALQEENITPAHIRIPVEPLLPFIKAPSLYLTYKPINIVKQWLLNLLWLFNKNEAKKHNIPMSCFLGILFSGEMDEKRLMKILPAYSRLAEKRGWDIEVLFHPGYLEKPDPGFGEKHVVFDSFYLSENRRKEYDSVMKFQKEVSDYAVY